MSPRKGHVFKPLADRLEEKSIPEPNSGCILWTGADNGFGYGKVTTGRQGQYAHRAAYELAFGSIPDGMQLDHLCRTPCCINPAHLEVVSNAENTRRGLVSALRPERHECKRGHDLMALGYVDSQGHRQCRACHSIRLRAYYQRKKG